ncbi:MAG: stage III sporulation protein AE [Lachnospiraceae bacterium]
MSRGRQWIRGLLCLLAAGLVIFTFPAEASETSGGFDGIMDGLLGLEEEWEALDQFLKQETGQAGNGYTFSEMVKMLMKGEGNELIRNLLQTLKEYLLSEISHGGKIIGQLLALGLIGAVFANFSDIFTGSQLSETGFFMTYLLSFVILAAGFSESVEIAREVMEKQVEFFNVLIPSYFLTVAWAGGSLSSIAWYEVVLFLIAAVQRFYLNILMPVTRIYILLVMAGHMAKEDMLSRLTDLLKTAIEWGIRSLLGVVLGFQVIQGMVLPFADSIQTAGFQKVLQVIPGVGQGASAVTKLLLGSGVLIKNTMGAAAVLVLLLVSLIPILKLAVLLFLYRAVAAVMQPVCDKRLVACISNVADGQKLLLNLVISTLLLFVITIALICAGTNVSYLA